MIFRGKEKRALCLVALEVLGACSAVTMAPSPKPTFSPTPTPTHAPSHTSMPTSTCYDYTLVLSDSFGDGWQGNVLHLISADAGYQSTYTLLGSATTGNWRDDWYRKFNACLPPGTYTPYACGGGGDDEVSSSTDLVIDTEFLLTSTCCSGLVAGRWGRGPNGERCWSVQHEHLRVVYRFSLY